MGQGGNRRDGGDEGPRMGKGNIRPRRSTAAVPTQKQLTIKTTTSTTTPPFSNTVYTTTSTDSAATATTNTDQESKMTTIITNGHDIPMSPISPSFSATGFPIYKKIIICCDGTWQNSDGSTPSSPTNITRLVRALLPATPASHRSPPIPQIVYYQAGIGSTTGSKLISGATGNSLPEHLREAYGFLAHNYSPGDSIHLFGFSRGAYTARCIAGLITRLGVLTKRGMDNFYSIYERFQLDGLSDDSFLKPYHNLPSSSDELKLVNYPVPITTIGCFDTVGALGIPTLPIPGLRDLVSGVNTKRYQFLDTTLSPGILNAFHALALDERRRPFSPTLWRKREGLHDAVNLKQCWFPGVHTNVGGGYTDQEIADITLAWMIQQCSPFLAFNRSYLRRIVENRGDGKGEWAAGKVEESFRGFHVLGGSKIRTPGGYGEGTEETIHVSVRLRKKVVGGWRCRAMEGWGWDEGERCWRMGERVLREEELGDWEVELAGREVVETVMVKAGTGLKDRGVKVKEVRKGSGGSRSGSGSEEVLV